MPRVNRCIELFEQDQPIYYRAPDERSHAGGVRDAQTWADYIVYDVEHHPFDMNALRAYMAGLIAGGPTRSGHRTPAVIVTLPFDGVSPDAVRANSWIIKQVLACGVHGLLLVHAESPEAVKTFVECARYPFNTIGVGVGLDEGRRGGGGQADAAAVWGLPVRQYLDRADPWPLNPHGELLLGLKIENKRALSNCELSLKVPGISFAEWGPGDMGMSLGFPDNHDEPYPPAMEDARSRVLAACMANDTSSSAGFTSTTWRCGLTKACASAPAGTARPPRRSVGNTPNAQCLCSKDELQTVCYATRQRYSPTSLESRQIPPIAARRRVVSVISQSWISASRVGFSAVCCTAIIVIT